MLRRMPFGVLVLAGLLAVLGAGLLFAAVYLLVRGDAQRLTLAALGAGPLLLYFSMQLARGLHWAWLASVFLLVLLAASSALRAVLSSEIPFAPLAELVVEGVFLVYLLRPHVRRAFRRAA